MKTTSSAVLEYEALRALVGRYIASPLGKIELARIEPHTDRLRLERDLAETEEALDYLRTVSKPQTGRGGNVRISFAGILDVTNFVHKLRIEGASLEPEELTAVLALLDRSADAKSNLGAARDRFPLLAAYAGRIGDFRALLRDIEGKILPDGSVADHASVALNRLRRDIERQKKSIQSSLERFLRAHQADGILQEDFVTIRNERFVVPVIAGQRRKMDGVIHGASASGATLFVEPLETIELNNELVRLTEEELREVYRILRELTDKLRAHAQDIQQSLEVMGSLDLIFAKARFASEFGCTIPKFGDRLVLVDARHPLLEDVLRKQRKPVVPISLELDSKCHTLLISGPNTGGKTVSLKTVGLLALMAQSAFPVPCAAAEFPIFDQILADIGDYQSIQESLSTFSAHISHIREMVLDVTPDSLVLLDELGAATDPEEGGALGIAIVDHFRRNGAYTLLSTHLLALKIYGASTDSVLNASMGFDESTLEPTYHLHTGLPGKSAGLDIAARLGMPDYIMQRARAALTQRDLDVSRFLAELHRSIEAAQTLEAELKVREAALKQKESTFARDSERREAAKLKELEQRCDAVLARFESVAQQTLGTLATQPNAQRKVGKARRELREDFAATVAPQQPETPRLRVEEGARVRLKNIREIARVRRILTEDRIEVEAGFMKLQVPLEDVIEILPEASGPSKLPKNVSFKPAPELAPLHQEINVIGQHAEEALDLVDQFLDKAVMATASRVRIVHGHGMGILRKSIADLLSRHPHVEKFYPAPQQEGGTGATIVELRE